MITYILESLAFQLVFLMAYDLWLKKETFFQWNRFYLLAGFVLSLVLPWIKLEILASTMPRALGNVTVLFSQWDGVEVAPAGRESGFWAPWALYVWVLVSGSLVSTAVFGIKLWQLSLLKRKGNVRKYPEYTKITVAQSQLAFSFFRNIFVGEGIPKGKVAKIILHELVHVRQKHSLDLVFFELAKILFWFNPLVYLFQNRMAELHEFIADSRVVKEDRLEHFELLLSQAFSTRNISFVNHFFHRSLIKKRILMLQKSKSKAIWQLKYVLMLPLVVGMLAYTSCETEQPPRGEPSAGAGWEESIEVGDQGELKVFTLWVGDLHHLTEGEESLRSELVDQRSKTMENGTIKIIDRQDRSMVLMIEKGTIKTINVHKGTPTDRSTTEETVLSGGAIPFTAAHVPPIFPGCETAVDKAACFQEKMKQHIMKHFHYPEQAVELGIQGRVSLLFILGADGGISDIRMRGPHELLEAEALRIIERLPRMQAAQYDGKAVNLAYSIPITFRLAKEPPKPQATGGMDIIGQHNQAKGVSVFRGRVTDGTSLALPGATISVVGTAMGVISDFDGYFAIPCKVGDVLKFEYIGLPAKTMVVADRH